MKRRGINEQVRSLRYFVLIVLINFTVICILGNGAVIGIKRYIHDTIFTYKLITCCSSICFECFFTLYTPATIIPWICFIVIAVGTVKGAYRGCSILLYDRSLINSLKYISMEDCPEIKKVTDRISQDNQPIVFYNNEKLFAFTLGILKPKIYLSTGLCSYLTQRELLAVIYHEMQHKKSKAPLKLFIVKILISFNFFIPLNRYLLARYYISSEKTADDAAVKFSNPLELASALIKLSSFNTTTFRATVPAFLSGQYFIENRINRLLEPEQLLHKYKKKYLRFYAVSLLSLLAASIICLSIYVDFHFFLNNIGCNASACYTKETVNKLCLMNY